MRQMAWIVGLITLTGCAQGVWMRDGATESNFAQEKAICEYQIESNTSDNYVPTQQKLAAAMSEALAQGIATAVRQARLLNLCMTAQGWTLVQQATSPPPTATAPVIPISAEEILDDPECIRRFGVRCPDWVKMKTRR